MGTNISNERTFFTLKPAEFYAKGIKELPDKWQQVIANDGKYIIDYGTIVIFLLKIKLIYKNGSFL